MHEAKPVDPPFVGYDELEAINKIVDSVNGRLRAMSQTEMQERAACSLAEYLRKYA